MSPTSLPSPNCATGFNVGNPHSAPWPLADCPLCGAKKLTEVQMATLRAMLRGAVIR